jgi:steroid delta-isomerase
MNPETVKKAVTDLIAAIQAKNQDAWLACFAEDVVSYNPVGTPPIRGLGGMSQMFDKFVGVFKDIKFTPESLFAAGNEVAVKYTINGQGKNGRMVAVEGINVYEVNDRGKIQTIRAYWNPTEMVAQLKK